MSDVMNSFMDKVRGLFNQVTGRIKQSMSKGTGDKRLENEGNVQELKGKGQKIVGHTKDIVGDVTDGVRETFKKTGT